MVQGTMLEVMRKVQENLVTSGLGSGGRDVQVSRWAVMLLPSRQSGHGAWGRALDGVGDRPGRAQQALGPVTCVSTSGASTRQAHRRLRPGYGFGA
jgi:hypothetical protein